MSADENEKPGKIEPASSSLVENILKIARLFKQLDNKRIQNKLDIAESKIFTEITDTIATLLDPDTAKYTIRRNFIRVAANYSVDLKTKESFQKAMIRNISGGGLFISTQEVLPVGEIVELTIRFPDQPEPMKIKSEVVWSQPYHKLGKNSETGMGVKFIELSPEQARYIQKMIHDFLDKNMKGLRS